MVTQERINVYKDWFENLSFFLFNSFVLDEIDNLWNLLNYIYFNYLEALKRTEFEKIDASNVSLEENIFMAQQFFDKNHINVSIKELIDSGKLIFTKRGEIFSEGPAGYSYYDQEKNRNFIRG